MGGNSLNRLPFNDYVQCTVVKMLQQSKIHLYVQDHLSTLPPSYPLAPSWVIFTLNAVIFACVLFKEVLGALSDWILLIQHQPTVSTTMCPSPHLTVLVMWNPAYAVQEFQLVLHIPPHFRNGREAAGHFWPKLEFSKGFQHHGYYCWRRSNQYRYLHVSNEQLFDRHTERVQLIVHW